MKLLARIVLAWLILAGTIAAASAAEEIRSFRSDIEVGADGTLRVAERIAVNVEGRRISRGIFRDIPLRFEDASGRLREVGLDILSVTRDGRPERFETERESGILRVRIGDPGVLLPHGVHSYEIVYETTRQIRFFDDHDELYWNVTGNGWEFAIREAVAEIRLPEGASASDVAFYTGPYGSSEQAASAARLDGGNRIRVEADRLLAPREGLTVAVALPKGTVAPPTPAEQRTLWWRDNASRLIGGFGLALLLSYYVWAWRRVGRDPPAGVVVPRWTPPEGISPALANYIEQRGFRGQGWEAFSAAVINLAVEGHLELENLVGDLIIRRRGDGMPAGIPVGEAAILGRLPMDGDTLKVDKANGERVQAFGKAFRTSIEREHRNAFYRHNRFHLIFGLALSAVVLVAMILPGGIEAETMIAVLGSGIPAAVMAMMAVSVGRSFRRAKSLGSRIKAVVLTAFGGFIALSVLLTTGMGLFDGDLDGIVLLIVGGLVMTDVVFFFLMGAPTPIGRKMMDGIAGLEQYLTLAEKDRMNMQGAPQMSPRHFETLLPYAVALGVEKPWSRAFDAWLTSAAAAGAAVAYMGPGWYSGGRFEPGSIGSDIGGITSSLSDSFTASLPAPKSSSSGFGGGGSSGGGGGGGGGGGW